MGAWESQLVDGVLVLLFAGWLLLTVINIGSWGAAVFRFTGPLSYLVPVWNFFAPNPAVHDYYVLYRDCLYKGEITPWREIGDGNGSTRRSRLATVWNPGKFQRKAVFDLAMVLEQEILSVRSAPLQPESSDIFRAAVRLSVPYLHILQYVSNLPRSLRAERTQFVLIRVDNVEEDVETLFVSEFHALSSASEWQIGAFDSLGEAKWMHLTRRAG